MMHKTKNTLPNNTRKTAISFLQARLFDTIDLAAQTKQAHWTVKGPNFIALHELFDTLHGHLQNHSDLIAERLTALGGQADGTIQSVAKHSTLASYDPQITHQDQHLDALSTALSEYSNNIRVNSDEAGETGDQNTSDLFTEISRDVDKSLWLLEAHQESLKLS